MFKKTLKLNNNIFIQPTTNDSTVSQKWYTSKKGILTNRLPFRVIRLE